LMKEKDVNTGKKEPTLTQKDRPPTEITPNNPSHRPSSRKPNALASAACQWLEKMLTLLRKMHLVLKEGWHQDIYFEKQIHSALEKVFQSHPHHPEFLSLFLDDVLKKSLKGVSFIFRKVTQILTGSVFGRGK
jgi:hypothetical protein